MKKGYMAIVTVLVLLAVTAGIASTLTFFSLDKAQGEDALSKGQQALYFSESCAEEGMLRTIHATDPTTYAGDTFTIPQGECDVMVTDDNGAYTLHAVGGKNGHYVRGVAVEFALDIDKLRVTDWKEE